MSRTAARGRWLAVIAVGAAACAAEPDATPSPVRIDPIAGRVMAWRFEQDSEPAEGGG